MLLLGLAVGGIVVYFLTLQSHKKVLSRLKVDLDKNATIAAEMQKKAERAEMELEWVKKQIVEDKKSLNEDLEKQRQLLRAEFQEMAGVMMKNQSADLRTMHVTQLQEMLQPLGENIEKFRTQHMRDNAAMERYIQELVKQAGTVGKEADNLVRALQGNNKIQGNWGEAILERILETSGLTEGRDFTLQHHTSDEEGKQLIPDVIVNLPGKRKIIIDSKVSLNAYLAAVKADNDGDRDAALKEHVASVKRNISKLASKNYAKSIKDSIGYVLMFIPNEAAYVAALKADPNLPAEAYAQRIILLNPTNLLMALQLAYNLWQSEMQSQSVNEIFASAEKLYKKFTLFAQNFAKIGTSIQQLQNTYTAAEGQLTSGRGNIIAQLEGWKKKGLSPTHAIPQVLLENTDMDDELEAPAQLTDGVAE
jgi:DNA recombination protein RmuC